MFHVEQTEKTIDICPSCGSSHFVTHLLLSDYFLSQEKFSLKKCVSCGLISTHPQPKPEEISRYYSSDKYISHSVEKKGLLDYLYNTIRNQTLSSKVKLINKYSQGSNLLDIGCATGIFINYCSKKGFQVTGVEPNETARAFAVEKLKLNVHNLDYLDKVQNQSFDIITMWHVLEHVHDLNGRLNNIYNILKDNGTAFIALPNHASYDASYYKQYWAAYDVPRHLYHFDCEAFKQLCIMHNFKIVAKIPMLFDSFYVSLLSEKYKKGKFSYLSAFSIGMISNFKALKTKDYSSIIYILKK